MIKRVLTAAAAVAVLLTLSACGTEGPLTTPGVSSKTVSLPDGRTVVCVVYSQGGVDCDWDSAE